MSTLEDRNGINRESTLFPSFDVATTPRSKKKTKKDKKKKKRNARKQFFGNYDSDSSSSSSSSSNSSSSTNSSTDSDDESTFAYDNIGTKANAEMRENTKPPKLQKS
ncbi:hypothetical protein IV203_008618 [Nitzschia inconspicua]|uniref:Uncharacterized protein n=1 Tax=Nitzschia inconspicua TaxID=303405 RepID=A0A9K3PM65_9STRA|nr:hypothetical protein IV203_008618 [Nitzschia inconspicua]